MESQKEKRETDTDKHYEEINNLIPETEITLFSGDFSPKSTRKKYEDYIDGTKDHVYMITHHIVHHRVEIPNVVVPKYPAATTPPPRLTFQQKVKRQIRRALERFFSWFRQFENVVEEKIHSASDQVNEAITDVKDSDHAEEKFSDAAHSATDKIMSKYDIDNVVKAFEKIKYADNESKVANESDNTNRKTQNLDENPNEIMRSSYEKVFKTAKERAKRVAN
ncbi:4611_t:CDS:1, partial [Ambispora leptoticha]